MQICPKCAKKYDDDMKICWTCGRFLDKYDPPPAEAEAATTKEVAPQILHEENPAPKEAVQNHSVWICPQCKKSVPANFDVCWNCFSAMDGISDPIFADIAAADRTLALDDEDQDGNEEEVYEVEAAAIPVLHAQPGTTCARCGSDQIVRNARVIDQGQASDGYLQVVVYGDPNALVFKDRLYGRLSADICGQCGHVELRVENPQELYEHYRKSHHFRS